MAAKILIIEDDKIMMSSTAMVLVETGGCDVVTAMGGAEGLEVALRESPDLILLDIMMPEMDGWEVLKHLKGNPVTAPIPVLIFTAYELDPTKRETVHNDTSGLVRKPFEPEELIDIVRRTASRDAG